MEPDRAGPCGRRASHRPAPAAVPTRPVGPPPARRPAHRPRRRPVRDQLSGMGTKPAGAAPRRAAAPLATAADPGSLNHHDGGRRGGACPALGRAEVTPANGADQTPAEDMEDLDPGLAGERTELAWTRTAISFAALGGAILKITPAVGVLVLTASALV